MTGEITLTGDVLPVGGILEKVLAANRAGLKTVILPRQNEPQLGEIRDERKKGLTFVLADSIEDVWGRALFKQARRAAKRAAAEVAASTGSGRKAANGGRR